MTKTLPIFVIVLMAVASPMIIIIIALCFHLIGKKLNVDRDDTEACRRQFTIPSPARRRDGKVRTTPGGDAQQWPVPSRHARTAPSDQDATAEVPKQRNNSVSTGTDDTKAGRQKKHGSDSAAPSDGDRQKESEPNNKQSLQVTTAPLDDTKAGRHKKHGSDGAAPSGGDRQKESEPNNKQSLQVTTAPLDDTKAGRHKKHGSDGAAPSDDTKAGRHKKHSSDGAAPSGGDRQKESEPNNKQSLLVTTASLVYTEARRQDHKFRADPPNRDAQQVPVPSPRARTGPLEEVPKQRKNIVSTDPVLAPGKPKPALPPHSTSGGQSNLEKLESVNLKSYKYEVLANSTGGFSHSNHLGDGGFGEVYKGTLADGKIAAIKKLKYQAGQKEDEFVAEVTIINRVHHIHLVKLLGYCDEDSNRLLVYEYVPNNSLRSHLHGKDKPILNWYNRIKIAIGSAKGLEYLHQYCNPKIVHRDIKADNILLDNNFEPKIADFGLARDFPCSVSHISTDPKGTFGYLAPECIKDRKLTFKSDVFSFGVVLLELITGKKSVFLERSETHNLAVWMMSRIEKALAKGNYDKLVDPKLEKKDIVENELARMTCCAAACVYKPARDRPDMSQIVEALQGKISLDRIWNSRDSKFFYDSTGKRRNLYDI